MEVAIFYWVCLILGIFMWTIGGIAIHSKLREITREVHELKVLVEEMREEMKEQESYIEPVKATSTMPQVSARSPDFLQPQG